MYLRCLTRAFSNCEPDAVLGASQLPTQVFPKIILQEGLSLPSRSDDDMKPREVIWLLELLLSLLWQNAKAAATFTPATNLSGVALESLKVWKHQIREGTGACSVLSDRKGSYLHDDIHGILVCLLCLPEGPHVKGADLQGQGTADGKEEKQEEGPRLRHPGALPAAARGQRCLACRH